MPAAATFGREDDGKAPCPKCHKVLPASTLKDIATGQRIATASDGDSSGAAASEGGSCGTDASGNCGGRPHMVMQRKPDALVRNLEEVRFTDLAAKSFVFGQMRRKFAAVLDYLKRELPRRGFQFRTLMGDMSRSKRKQVLKDFFLQRPQRRRRHQPLAGVPAGAVPQRYAGGAGRGPSPPHGAVAGGTRPPANSS
ncbi:unnamed protein product [Phaeothamnion confervicola]